MNKLTDWKHISMINEVQHSKMKYARKENTSLKTIYNTAMFLSDYKL